MLTLMLMNTDESASYLPNNESDKYGQGLLLDSPG